MAVTISYGADTKTDDIAGLTVEQARAEYASVFNIAPDSIPIVNGKEVEKGYVLQDGDKLEFSKSMVKRLDATL